MMPPRTAPSSRIAVVVPVAMSMAMIALLLGLGIWQIQRGLEKRTLIAALDARLARAPEPLPPPSQWPALRQEQDEFRRVRLEATFLDMPPALVFTSASALRTDVSGTGYWVFAPAKLSTGQTIVINRGFVADAAKADAPAGLPPGRTVALTGYLRFPEPPGWFIPQPDPARHLWYGRDTGAMGAILAWGEGPGFYIDMEQPAPAGAGPRPAPLAPRLPNNHIQYAATWFALAAVILVLAVIWWRSQRRKMP